MQDAPAFIITNGVKNIFFIRVMVSHQVLVFTSAEQVSLHVFQVVFISIILSVFIFTPQVFAVIGKTFINGNITPAFCGNKVTKPLVKQFMCNGSFPDIAVF